VPFGPPYTLDQAYPFVRKDLVAFGFPDILFEPEDAYVQLLNCQKSTQADIVLGLFPVTRPETMDMVDLDERGVVRSIVIKPPQTHLQYGWIIAVWTPLFTDFLHEHLRALDNHGESAAGRSRQHELTVGHVLKAAIENNLRVRAVVFPAHSYLDIGTPGNLLKACKTMDNSLSRALPEM
jgi:glucose-1-phosphate thymidylyltransferase